MNKRLHTILRMHQRLGFVQFFQDEVDAARLYGNARMLDDVNIDDEMVKSTKIRLKHSAYVRLLTTKIGITKKLLPRRRWLNEVVFTFNYFFCFMFC